MLGLLAELKRDGRALAGKLSDPDRDVQIDAAVRILDLYERLTRLLFSFALTDLRAALEPD